MSKGMTATNLNSGFSYTGAKAMRGFNRLIHSSYNEEIIISNKNK